VDVIDGTGAPGRRDQTIVIRDGRIAAVGPAGDVHLPGGAPTMDLRGRTVIPGLVGMHEHLFYQMQTPGSDLQFEVAQSAFAKLYLASGVTTIRTAGTIDFGGDLRLKRRIDANREPGPTVHVTSPYLEARGKEPDVEGVVRDVRAWADEGATSFKAGPTLRTEELRAAIQTAHDLGLRVTGHLCAVGFRQAAALGIDNLEHGLLVDTEFYSGKERDVCPDQGASMGELARLDIQRPEVYETIAALVNHGVSVTSTLAVFETFTTRDSALDPRTLTVLSPGLREQYQSIRAQRMGSGNPSATLGGSLLRKEMEFERAFVAAGGRLLAGVDPTGWGGVVAGFGDQRQLELLVEAGFTAEQAIKIASSNGANFLRENDIGTIAVGSRADLVILRGNPSTDISNVRRVEWVMKGGVVYDPEALVAATEGAVGAFDPGRLLRWPLNVLTVAIFALAVLALRRRLRGWQGATASMARVGG
jgi:imidazolonepropionase-like amidohydrolase